MAKKPTTKLEKLQKVWNAKLKESGFKDIEYGDNQLREPSTRFIRDRALNSIEGRAKREYYQLAEYFLNEHKFSSNLERVIWEYHTNAISIRNIVKLLREAKVLDSNRNAIWTILNRLETLMKKKYLKGYRE